MRVSVGIKEAVNEGVFCESVSVGGIVSVPETVNVSESDFVKESDEVIESVPVMVKLGEKDSE